MKIQTALGAHGTTSRFGRLVRKQELDTLKDLVRQIPELGETAAKNLKPQLCILDHGFEDRPSSAKGYLKRALATPGALADMALVGLHLGLGKLRRTNPDPTVVIQWVKFPTARGAQQWAPRQETKKPDHFGAAIGNNLINWWIYR